MDGATFLWGAAGGVTASALAARFLHGPVIRRRLLEYAQVVVAQQAMLDMAARDIATYQTALMTNVETTHDTLVAVRLAAEEGVDIRDDLDGMIRGLADGLSVMREHTVA